MYRFVFISCFALFITGCNKDDGVESDRLSGEASAKINGELWEFPIHISDNRVDPAHSLILAITHNSTEDGEIFRRLSMTRIKPSLQIQQIEIVDFYCIIDCPVMSRYSTTFESDVGGDRYSVDTVSTNNFIQITDYDPSRAEIEGIFNVTYVLSHDDGHGETPPERLEFRDGKFEVRVEREWFE